MGYNNSNYNSPKFEFDRIDMTDLIIIVSLAIGLIMSVYMHEKELSMSIVSGMFGYVGGGYVKQNQRYQGPRNYNTSDSKPNADIIAMSNNKVSTNKSNNTSNRETK